MGKIFIASLVGLSLAAAASAQALHVVHLRILQERTRADYPRAGPPVVSAWVKTQEPFLDQFYPVWSHHEPRFRA
jgi:hypothetical protein